MKSTILVINFLLLCTSLLKSQVTSVIYFENFNSGNGGWSVGGFHPSWNYGIPTLPNIVSNGTPCFATGDAGEATTEPFAACLPFVGPSMNGNFYNCCERSFVESPVIDLTGVTSPLLSLDINVFCEQTFDGAKVQISLNGGNNWQDIGAYSASAYLVFPNIINCREQNWYNKNNVSYLTSTNGGCGNVNFAFGGGNSGWSGGCAQAASAACGSADAHGTNGWKTASLCIPQAANKPAFKLRIDFGSGSQVYADGIAFDNVKITDVFPVVNFSGNQSPGCDPQYQFNNITDCANTYSWNFGHAAPGNTSSLQNPLHEFPTAGNFNVSLTATDFCGGSASFSQQVVIAPGNAPVITNVLATPTQLCDSASGSLTISLNPAGTGPYNLSFINSGSTISFTGLTGNPIILQGLYPGNYNTFFITDSNGCEAEFNPSVNIPYNSDQLTLVVTGDTIIEPGDAVLLSVTASVPSSYSWFPAATLDSASSATPVATPLVTTTYFVSALDSNGCVAINTVTIFVNDKQPCDRYFFPNTFTPNGDGKNEFFKCYIDPEIPLLDFHMIVYNRWGQLVFDSTDPGLGWNGKNVPSGIYAVIADFKCINKKTSRYSGVLNLVR